MSVTKDDMKYQIEKMELIHHSKNTPKRKQKLLVHYSNHSQSFPSFRQLFAKESKPIENLKKSTSP